MSSPAISSCRPRGAEAIALWILHAWCIDAAGHSPLLAFVSPERRCGKSSALTLLLWLCPRSEQASSITASVIYRFVEQSRPTLLIDELDNAIEDNRDLLAILNGGHNRAMAHVLRSVGDGMDFTPQRFSAWSAEGARHHQDFAGHARRPRDHHPHVAQAARRCRRAGAVDRQSRNSPGCARNVSGGARITPPS